MMISTIVTAKATPVEDCGDRCEFTYATKSRCRRDSVAIVAELAEGDIGSACGQ
jgi:hypothetical protein